MLVIFDSFKHIFFYFKSDWIMVLDAKFSIIFFQGEEEVGIRKSWECFLQCLIQSKIHKISKK